MNRVVLITGVVGGIGAATAKLFAERGWWVVGVDQQPIAPSSAIARFVQVDLGQPAAPARILAEVTTREGRLDALVNNAALQICKPLLATTAQEWDQIMAVNLRSAFLLAQCAYPLLKTRGGAIVNVSSVHAVATSTNIAAYAASKGGLLALTRAMALEFAQDGIRVNAILPGAVDTPMLQAGLERGHVQGADLQERVCDLGRKHPLGRVGKPDEMGQAILFLADNNQSSFMTGQALVVDGGAIARLSTE